jgi:hypothetical protein
MAKRQKSCDDASLARCSDGCSRICTLCVMVGHELQSNETSRRYMVVMPAIRRPASPAQSKCHRNLLLAPAQRHRYSVRRHWHELQHRRHRASEPLAEAKLHAARLAPIPGHSRAASPAHDWNRRLICSPAASIYGRAHQVSRRVIDDHSHSAAERPALRQGEWRPSGPDAARRRHDGQVDSSDQGACSWNRLRNGSDLQQCISAIKAI